MDWLVAVMRGVVMGRHWSMEEKLEEEAMESKYVSRCCECGVDLTDYERDEFGDMCGECEAELRSVIHPNHPDDRRY